MKIIEHLQPDFICEVMDLYGERAYQVLNEQMTGELWHSRTLRPGDSFSFYSLPLYVITRITRPRVVVETGTQNGGSAQAILCALDKNQYGCLYSIDSGVSSTDGSHSATHGLPGHGITARLKNRWFIEIGFSYDILPRWKIPQVDLFFHDSDHSKQCVEFEFREILRRCRKGSLLGLHDHYGQWDHKSIMAGCEPIIGHSRPEVHEKDGQYHNVLRLWRHG